MDLSSLVLFSTPTYAYLRDALVAALGAAPGTHEQRTFPDGERYLRLVTSVRERDAVLVGGTVTDADTLDVFDLANGLVKEGARSVTLLVPFFGYATMERQVRPGEVVVAKTRARLLSAIPAAPLGNRVGLLDLHADGLAYYFEGGMVPQHLYAKDVVLAAIREVAGTAPFALGSVDAGRAKWVESLANDLGVTASFILKRRVSGSQTEVIALSAAVKGARVVIYDDMIRTGGSLLGAARAYLDAGAVAVDAVTTHAVLPGDSLERIRKSGLVGRIICTDSHPRARQLEAGQDYLQVRSCAPVFEGWLRTLCGVSAHR